MKFHRFLSVALMAAALSFNAQAQNTSPLLWTSVIDVVGNYVRSDSEGTFVSRFTPGVAVTVTRMQLQAAFGSSVNGHKCSPVPRIRVTDGTTSHSIAIPNAREVGSQPFSVHADSGPIAVSFPANANLVLRVLPGETGCNPGSINVTVQYSVN
jgi:hypothetical protein